MTKEQKSISYQNRKKAKALLNPPKGYDMHHKDPSWRTLDIERYILWNIEDLEILPHDEHIRLHAKLNGFGKDSHQAWNKGLPKEQQPCYGKHNTLGKHWDRESQSEETKQKISNSLKGHTTSEETKQKLRLAALKQWERQKGL